MTGGQAECTRFRLGSWLVPARQQEQSTGSALVRPLALALLTSVTTLSGTCSARARPAPAPSAQAQAPTRSAAVFSRFIMSCDVRCVVCCKVRTAVRRRAERERQG